MLARISGRTAALFALLVSACGGVTALDVVVDGNSDASASHDASARDVQASIDPGVFCSGGVWCPVPAQVCCRGDGGAPTCTPAGACNGLAIPCDDSADCTKAGFSGDVCCASVVMSLASEVQCRSPASCFTDGVRTALCDPQSAAPCPAGKSCSPSTVSLPGYDLCK